MAKPKAAVVIWGTQLTLSCHSALKANPELPVIMIESKAMCQKFKYHKQKLVFVLTAMRAYADELSAKGRTVYYSDLETSDDNWYATLDTVCKKHGITKLHVMRSNDRAPQQQLINWCQRHSIELETTPNTMFLTATATFNEWAEDQKRLQLEQFYRWQRLRLNILIEHGKPTGGKWNYDAENREPLAPDTKLPHIPLPEPSKHMAAVKKLVREHFADHPGDIDIDWIPTTRKQATEWLNEFIKTRFKYFGKYEDAMLKGETFIYHSALSAVMNIGLLHPSEIISAALEADVPLASKEGFIRQIIGWREFMFGLYNFKPADWKNDNHLKQRKKLPDWWWKLEDAPEPPLEDVLKRLKIYGYSHHIERLMVLGNYMLLAGYNPREVYDWFMTMYVDAYEWVMVPNVIGMSQYADGGVDNGGFATKPYISGSNYLQKMGHWWPTAAAAKDSEWTTNYWDFLERHEDTLANNFRLKPLYATIRRRKG